MNANKEKKIRWTHVIDWSNLTTTSCDILDGYDVSESDVDEFVENIFKEVARNLNIPYKEIKPILDEKNSAFYSAKVIVFKTYGNMKAQHPILLKLESLLTIPEFIPDYNNEN